MKTWREAYGETWLADGDKVAAIDGWVRRTLCRHRELDALHAMQSVAPWSVETLARSVGAFGDAGQWLWCVTAVAILQELIFCAEDGGIDPAGVATDGDLQPDVEVLRAIRNVVLHPASQLAKGNKPPPMLRLISLFEADDDASVTELALRLPDDWSYLAERPVATYALRKLGSAGELFLQKMRLLEKRSPGLSR